ncbi:rhodanese-like domain-containing protein [Roseateles microcysteis]|uniref:rhodanese-like domain-containing protein n=1 Tax=Roseateles microcysteis TaxID=3119057 RepID=UPI002FE535B1|eukprot:gene38512-47559_t
MQHLLPKDAHAFLQRRPEALFLDIRMELEYLYVGHPPGVVHLAWYEYPEMQADAAQFVAQVRREARDRLDTPVVLICRSGQRTVAAGEALEAAGFTEVVNVLHGFEGELDANFQRGRLSGWRFDGLPWEQM